jgi:SAM-dependent methyltransferase
MSKSPKIEVKCKLCGSQKTTSNYLELRNMPSVAQYYPTEAHHSSSMLLSIFAWQCDYCGLTQIANAPVPYFKEVVRSNKVSSEMFNARSAQFSQFIESNKLQNNKVIEIGCGAGENLVILRQYCSKVYGIEYSLENVAKCRELDLPVHQGFPDKANGAFLSGPFDAFFTFNVLEHVPEPVAWLRNIHLNLKSGAPGIIEVPNYDIINKAGLATEFMSEHLMYFSESTLKMILEINGFEVEHMELKFSDYVLSAQVRKKLRADFSKFTKFQSSMNDKVKNLMSQLQEGTTVVWGAGHQSLAFINQFELSKHVNYVVDSATTKQNKFAPGTLLKIKSPTELFADSKIKNVLVITAGYNSEVVKILKKDWIEAGKRIFFVHYDTIEEVSI